MSGFHPVASGSIPGIGSFVKLLQVRLEEFFSCFSALLAQLAERNPPKVEAVGSIPTSGFALSYVIRGRSSVQSAQRTILQLILFFRYGVVGNMSGSHPVASGSIPGIGLSIEKFLVLLAQLAEHPLNILAFLAQSAERCANNFSLVLGPRERFVWKRNGRRFDPGRKLQVQVFFFF